MSTSSQSPSSAVPTKYEPRYQVGDLIRDGLGATCKITEIRRASSSDGHSDVRAVKEGFTTYEYRRLSDGYRSVLTTSFMHHMIDTKFRLWAYLGPVPPIAAADTPLPTLVRELAVAHVAERAARAAWLLAHPEAATAGRPCSKGEAAEQRHLLYDADPDAAVPAFPYPTPQEAS